VGRLQSEIAVRPDVRIYNYALTATQIKSLYNNGAVNFSN
jgi:hypothetical protein